LCVEYTVRDLGHVLIQFELANNMIFDHEPWELNDCFSADRDGFSGLVVRILASVSRVRGFKPGRSRWIFLYIKILSVPSFGGEVK
jgi:hypothetical protein